MPTSNVITTLVGEELEEESEKYGETVAAPNGSLYGIPACARKVVKFDPVDKSITYIGPDFEIDGMKWYAGAMTDNGVIYCPPTTTFMVFSRSTRIPTRSQNWIEIVFQNKFV